MASNIERDDASYNRVFIVGGKDCKSDDFRREFEKYGTIKDLWMVEDKKTGEFKGVTYITYSKASEAARAIEEKNGGTMGSSPRAMRVLLANDKREGNVRDPKENERTLRLFIIVPKSYSEADVKEKFEEYGKVDSVRVLKDKSGNNKGLAFVKYFKAYHCALALENCDESYRAVFAAPQNSGGPAKREDKWSDYDKYDEPYSNPYSSRSRGHGSRDYGPPSYDSYSTTGSTGYPERAPLIPTPSFARPSPMADLLKSFSPDGENSLEVMAAPGVTRDQLYAILDMTPGLEYCELDRESGVAYVTYKYPQCAAHAKEKLAFMEFPPGYRIAVRMGGGDIAGVADATASLASTLKGLEGGHTNPGNLQTLVESIKKATTILERAGMSDGGSLGGSGDFRGVSERERIRYCNIPLPYPQPMADRDDPVAERLFIVSQPEAFNMKYLQDVMCRFGGLIDCFFMPGKNFGYVKFASKESAERAINVLHGQTVCDMKLKVMKADPPRNGDDGDRHGGKRQRVS